jgi:glycosyltransferase involved in cell wall biosynthesis
MLIHHLSSANFKGGAARAGYRLHQGLAAAGYTSRWLDAGRDSPQMPDVLRIKIARRFWKGWARFFRLDERRRFRRAFRSASSVATLPSGPGKASLIAGPGWPEIFHFHWVSDFLDWDSALPLLTSRVPVVWTLHDLNPLIGAWHYDPDPTELNARRIRWDNKLIIRKKSVLSKLRADRLAFVAPSNWMAERARACEATARFSVHQIPNTLNIETFCPGERDRMRMDLGLPLHARIVGFVAESLQTPRKGLLQLTEALAVLPANERVLLATIGGNAGFEGNRYCFGTVTDEARLRAFYAACDIFVCPSLQDNLPNTVLEAMACGTPVVAFDTGGLGDLVKQDESGCLVKLADVGALSRVISELLSDDARRLRLGRKARAVVEADFSPEVVARRHIDLYREMIASSGM